MPPENQREQGNRNSHCPIMAQPTMVPLSSPASLLAPMDPEPRQAPPSTPRTSETTPSVEKTEVDGMSCMSQEFFRKIQHFWKRCRHPHGIVAIRHPKTVQDLH